MPVSEATFLGDDPPKRATPPSKPELPKDANLAAKSEEQQGTSVATKTPATPTGWSTSSTKAPAPELPPGEIAAGMVLGHRYEIIALLGQGGMGAVYKARDTELDRLVALKIIRPELTTNPEILKRFKQELILARQVTHRNVIRIFDLGQADGFKFITMEYLEGQDLRAVIRERGKLPPEEAAIIIVQICRALQAAHSEGVIHRDLKPQNIMLDANGRAYVMDFGIARSAYLPGMTQTGALVGTPEYMSPEQAKGEKLGERSDLFSLGVILYELLIGQSPYYSDTPLATLWKRIQEKATPLIEVDPTIPKELSDIVAKALEIEPENRFANANEFAQQLESWLGVPAESTTIVLPAPRITAYWKWASGALAILLVAAVIGFRLKGPTTPKPPHAPVSVLVADFTNHTGDPIFDGTLEPMFNVALEGASFVNAFSRGDARKLAQKLPHPTDKLDEQSARLIAVSQGIGDIVTGELSRRGDGYKLSVEAMDGVSGNTIASADVTAANKDEVLLAIPKVAAPIRKALGDTTPASVQLAAAETFSAASLEAAHQYSIAQEQAYAGQKQDALRSYSKAVELDPNFGRAYSGIATVYRNLGQTQDAERSFKMAMEHVDRMTERERYRTRGAYYITIGNYQKAVEEYGALLKQYPSDNIAHNNLGVCFKRLRDMPRAVEEARRAVEISPKAAMPRMNLALYSLNAGDFQTGEREARQVLQLSPAYEKGYLTLAYAQLGQGQAAQAAETYQKLEKISALGASLAASGLADVAIYEGRFSDATRILEAAVAADIGAKKPNRAAADLGGLAYAQLSLGHRPAALAAAEKAFENDQAVQIRFLAAHTFVEAGESAKAQKLAAALASDSKAEPQAYAKLIEGEVALKAGNVSEAVKEFTEANNLLDTWIGHFGLGRTYLQGGFYVEADSEFDVCIKRRGEAVELFTDDMPTYSYLPPVYYYQGRVREGLKSPGAGESYRTYLTIRGKSSEDALVAEIHRRLGQ